MIKKPKIVNKNWGREIHWTNNTNYCGKTLVLKSGCHCSLHSHWKREHFMIQSGNVKLALEKRLLQDKDIGEIAFFDLSKGDCIEIPRNFWHSFYGVTDSEIVEFSTPDEESKRLFKSGRNDVGAWKKLVLETQKNENMKTILVTGSEGFIGSRFVDLNKDKYRIFNLNKSDTESLLEKSANFESLSWVDVESQKTYKFSDIDAVFHFGAETDTTSSNTQEYFRYNCLFTNRLIDECYQNNIPLIFSSSASLYGSGDDIPLNLYAWSKWTSEQYGIEKASRSPSLNKWQFTALRYFNVYGIGEHNKNIKMTSLVYQNLKNNKIKLFTGKPLRDFIFVDDVVSANVHAFETEQSGVFDVGSCSPRSFEDIAGCLGVEIEYIDNPIKDQYQFYTCADKTKTLDNWSAEYSLESGIKKMKEYYFNK